MSDQKGIFFDEWQACLRAHYVHVVRAEDTVTEPTLRHVLLQTGLTDDDIEALREEAHALGPLPPEEDDPGADDASDAA
ncbi:MAG: hypothetical protein K8S97_13950 [Anaerolineae bacterium]|nr:hypothetical protein [Anaerolineae bacterium]